MEESVTTWFLLLRNWIRTTQRKTGEFHTWRIREGAKLFVLPMEKRNENFRWPRLEEWRKRNGRHIFSNWREAGFPQTLAASTFLIWSGTEYRIGRKLQDGQCVILNSFFALQLNRRLLSLFQTIALGELVVSRIRLSSRWICFKPSTDILWENLWYCR